MSVNFTAADRVGVIGGYIGGIAQLLGGLGNMATPAYVNGGGCCSENTPVTRYELDMALASAAKDERIAILEAEKYSDQKLVDTYKVLDGKINDVKDAQDAVNREQAVYNGVNTATIACIKGQVADLMGLTQLKIPNTSVCPGWGSVTVTPATAGTTVS